MLSVDKSDLMVELLTFQEGKRKEIIQWVFDFEDIV